MIVLPATNRRPIVLRAWQKMVKWIRGSSRERAPRKGTQMETILNQSDINRIMVAIHNAIVASFDKGDWSALAFQTDTLRWVERHPRLLRSLDWRDDDYPGNDLAAVTKILDTDLDNLRVMLENEKIIDWLRENDRSLYEEFIDDITAPSVDHASAIHNFLWRATGRAAKTRAFRNKRHDPLVEMLRTKAEKELPGEPRIVMTQSLQDAG